MKYEFTGETKVVCGVTLKRIRALVSIAGVVAPGDAGGWIESENNLDQFGNAWVYGNAQVYDNAWVYGDAQVYGGAWVYGNARVSQIDALCAFVGFGSQSRQTTAFRDEKIGVRVVCGCFTGTIDEFREAVIKTHGEDSKHGKLYLGMANMIEYKFMEEA